MLTPQRSFILPEWTQADLVGWDGLAQRAFRVAAEAGRGAHFHRVVDDVRRLIEQKRFEEIDRRLSERRFARALVTVWHDDQEMAAASLTGARVAALVEAQQPRISRLTTVILIAVLLRYFDHLDRWHPGLLAALGSAAQRAVSCQAPRDSSADLVEAFRRDHHHLTRADGPTRLAENLAITEVPLDEYFRLSGMLGFDGGRFGERLRHAYYIAQIREADHTAGGHPFLLEVTSRTIAEAPGRDGLYFGHEVLEALTDKPGQPPSDEWLGAVIDLGGDPRLRNTSKWRKWWQPVSQRARDQVTRWLSAEDLRLFLTAVETFAENSNNPMLRSHFPPRKRFLWGLYESGHVRETRLILGSKVRNSVKRQLGGTQLDAALLERLPNLAIIVLDCGDFHVIEGSHSFKLWLFAGQPVAELFDRERVRFTPDQFRSTTLPTAIPYIHAKRHPKGTAARMDITHHGFWQRRALEFLISRCGVDLNPAELLTPEDYDRLKREVGLPVRAYRLGGE